MIITGNPSAEFHNIVTGIAPDTAIIVADQNTAMDCVPILNAGFPLITIASGEENKNLDSVTRIWTQLSTTGVTRHSLIINVGGGMVTDLGGFAAATFKRGIRFVNVATSLLGMVDASSGGKTGINFSGLKNEIGVFRNPEAVIVSPLFLKTLPREELLSGYGEMLKHAVIGGDELLAETIAFSPLTPADDSQWIDMLRSNIAVKENIVETDPKEKGLRKTLNLGHTIGHAIESHCILSGSTIPHGYAVAWGLLAETILAHLTMKSPSRLIYTLAPVVDEFYGMPPFTCDDYHSLYELMGHDKKNLGKEISFTLPLIPGEIECDCRATYDDVTAALDILRDLLHA